LKKIKKTGQQSQLNKLQRQENLKDCFAVNDKFVKFIKNKNIIIVDDVVST
jgi:predicted amidophosphoribosyltransferase